jgi:hypothetical protein
MRRLPWRQLTRVGVALAGLAAFGALISGVAQGGPLAAWALVLFFWLAAVLAALAQATVQRQDPVSRYVSRHEPLAGPRPGAELPG